MLAAVWTAKATPPDFAGNVYPMPSNLLQKWEAGFHEELVVSTAHRQECRQLLVIGVAAVECEGFGTGHEFDLPVFDGQFGAGEPAVVGLVKVEGVVVVVVGDWVGQVSVVMEERVVA